MKNNHLAILFSGILYSAESYRDRALKELATMFGPFRSLTEPVEWHSEHYAEETGRPLQRQFVFFSDLVEEDGLAGIKNSTRRIEKSLSVEGRRKVNLDPGILAPARVVLATTKDYAHRVYLGEGIFAEVTLVYRDGKFRPGPFAYSDYSDDRALEMFADMRAELLNELGNDK